MLIVDTDHSTCQQLKAVLTSRGFSVRIAHNGGEALSYLKKEHVDGIIAEVILPGMDGLQLLQRVNHDKTLKKIPFIFLTDVLDKEDAPLVQAVGAELLSKSDLNKMTKIQSVLKTPKALKNLGDIYYQKYSELLKKILDKTYETLEETQKRLSYSEAKYKKLFERASDATFLLDKRGIHIEVNEKASELLGYTTDELRGLSFRDIVVPQYIPDSEQKLVQLLQGEEIPVYEKQFRAKDGKIIPVEISVSGIRDETGEITYIQSIVRDITERKQSEEEMKYQLTIEKAVSTISRLFASLQHIDFNDVLQILGEAVSADRGYIFEIRKSTMDNTYEWCAPGITPQITRLQGLKINRFSWWMEQLNQGDVVISDVEELLPDTVAEKKALQGRGVRSLVVVPITSTSGEFIGFMGFEGTKTQKKWLGEDVRALRLVTEMIAVYWERRQTEEQSRESEQKYKTIVELAPDGIITTDLKGTITSCNTAFEKIAGFPKEELVGKSFVKLPTVRAKDIPQYARILRSLLRGRVPKPFETSWLYKGETERWGEVHITLMKKNSVIIGSQAIVRDITERKQAEEVLQHYRQHLEESVDARTAELKQANKQLQKEIHDRNLAEESLAAEKEQLAVTLRSIGDGVITTDTDGKIVLLNKVAEALTGYTQEEAVGRPLHTIFTIISERTRIPCENPVDRVLSQGAVVGLGNDTVLISRDGTEKIIADSGAPIRDKNSQVIGVVLVFRDITEKRKMELELLRTQKLESLGILAGGIAHDFNNILTAIFNNVTLARMHTKDNVTQTKLAKIEKASLQATELTQQLLTFSKGGAPVKKMTSVKELIRDSTVFALRGSNVRCHFYMTDELWSVDVDEGQISQVINNVIINADQAMPEGGIITVKAENVVIGADQKIPLKPGSYIKITITDQGVGIPQQYLQKVFDPYFTTKQKGSGLGLATSYSIVKRHSGHIDVESTAGEGTTVSIWLPAAEEAPKREKVHHDIIEGRGKVLLMDDEESILEAASEVLQVLGYTVVTAEDGEEAVNLYSKALETEPFDVVIMDLTIPGGMGGKETISTLLTIDSDVKAIVSSGYSTDPVMANYKKYGFKGVVTKPYTIEELSEVLHTVIAE